MNSFNRIGNNLLKKDIKRIQDESELPPEVWIRFSKTPDTIILSFVKVMVCSWVSTKVMRSKTSRLCFSQTSNAPWCDLNPARKRWRSERSHWYIALAFRLTTDSCMDSRPARLKFSVILQLMLELSEEIDIHEMTRRNVKSCPEVRSDWKSKCNSFRKSVVMCLADLRDV